MRRYDLARFDSLPHGACGMISAVILAAGQSKRMGQPKMLLPWGNISVIEHIVSVFAAAGMEDILVVTGGEREQVEDIVEDCKSRHPVRSVFNEDYLQGEMLSSIQCGLRYLQGQKDVGAALIGLGDQPQVEERSVRAVCEAFLRTESSLVAPSFQMRRGHPWLAARERWKAILSLRAGQTLRDFLNTQSDKIHYVDVDTPSILADLDTPEAYKTARPK